MTAASTGSFTALAHRCAMALAAAPLHAALAQPAATLDVPQAATADPPVTVVVTRFARRGCEKSLEALWRDMIPVRNRFPGHLGSDIILPSGAFDSSYHMLFRFDHESHYQAWAHSPERAEWLRKVDAMTTGEPQYQYENSLGAWVTLPEQQGRTPEKYKTTTVTWLAIVPLVAGVTLVATPLIAPAPLLVRTAVITGVVVPALSYVVMPPMTWLFRDWLYPPDPVCTAANPAP